MTKEEVLNQIKEIESDYEEFKEDGKFTSIYSRDSVFNNASWILQEFAEEKKMEYVGYFRTKYEKNAEFLRIQTHPFLDSQTEKRNLYVFMSAQDDQEIFECLEYVYNITHDEALNENVLKKEILNINRWGIIFARN